MNHSERFLAEFAYIGSSFHGVQEQPGQCTVLGVLRRRIEESAGAEARSLVAAARTDRGVHALQNFATFSLRAPVDIARFIVEATSYKNDGLLSLVISPVGPKVHARGSARAKTYRYTIKDGILGLCTDDHSLAWEISPYLSIDAMAKAARDLVGKMDFSSLRGGGCQAGSAIKDVMAIMIRRNHSGYILIEITGAGFLRKMIRNMVGLLVEIGAGFRAPDAIRGILKARARNAAGIMAPAHGLCLVSIEMSLNALPKKDAYSLLCPHISLWRGQ